ncbi:FRG domain-containing protein [Parvibaculum sp.]|uniref:FRG domain-containing protein n=1 Tax=Parvibaculum sp. TaxID=2024848 RepID=UPI002604442D|nr:FRG domain-containing protein [Parvibaculum sp.]MCW5728360.1 FRG domain-containing protein [Parvibaculum sp.]
MEIHVESAEAALEKCWQLVRDGRADLFRGQTCDWPKLVPSIFRASDDDRTAAIEELEYFKEWASFVPQMAAYKGDSISITAIAQHYGIPTTFLDLTTSPEIALLFAKQSGGCSEFSEAVIYCFLEAGLKVLPDGRLTRINVDNLWRLESQRGLFLQYDDERLADALRSQAIHIYFPTTPLSAEEKTRLYPVRKSALEVIIDQWTYRRTLERVTDSFTEVKYKVLTHRQTHPGVFRWRSVPELEASWIKQESAWIFPPVESVSIVDDPAVIVLPQVDLSDPAVAQRIVADTIRGPIREHRATGKLVSFAVQLSKDRSAFSDSVATLINRCWDGLRVLPYEAEEAVASIALTSIFLLARTEGIEGVDEWSKRMFGELLIIEVAPIGGHIEAGSVSRADLLKALSGEHVDKMTAYMRRKAADDPEFLMLYVVDHWMLFEFTAFKKLFVEQFIPSMMDGFWKQDLDNNEGTLDGLWSVNFNPALLGYVTPFSFRFRSPIAMAKDCDQLIYISPDMECADLEELFISCMPNIEGNGPPYQVLFDGYSGDSREIWEIARVVEQCKWIVKVGGISVLECFPFLMPNSCEEQGRPAVGIGAFEIWLIAERKFHETKGKTIEETKHLFDQFWAELMIANANIETRAKAARDWPGPRSNT